VRDGIDVLLSIKWSGIVVASYDGVIDKASYEELVKTREQMIERLSSNCLSARGRKMATEELNRVREEISKAHRKEQQQQHVSRRD